MFFRKRKPEARADQIAIQAAQLVWINPGDLEYNRLARVSALGENDIRREVFALRFAASGLGLWGALSPKIAQHVAERLSLAQNILFLHLTGAPLEKLLGTPNQDLNLVGYLVLDGWDSATETLPESFEPTLLAPSSSFAMAN